MRRMGSGVGLRPDLAAPVADAFDNHPDTLLAASLGHGHGHDAAALERVRQWTLADVMPHLTQPLLIVHGEHDTGFPVAEAEAAFAAAGSKDKTLRIFTIEEGGSEHVNVDDPDPARQRGLRRRRRPHRHLTQDAADGAHVSRSRYTLGDRYA